MKAIGPLGWCSRSLGARKNPGGPSWKARSDVAVRVVSREEKTRTVDELAKKLAEAKSAILTDFKGLDVQKMSRLRGLLREENVEYRVVKNTLTRRAAAAAGVLELQKHLEGPTALAFSYDDAVIAAKKLVEFAQENRVLKIKAGLVEGRLVNGKDITELAKLPPKPVLLGMVAGGLLAPVSRLAYAFGAPLSGFANALSQLAKSREE